MCQPNLTFSVGVRHDGNPALNAANLNLRKYLNLLDEETTQKAYACFKEIFLNPEKQGNIRSLSESQYQEGFCRELFSQCLGYTIAPDPGYNLKTEQRNQTASSDKYDNRKADAAIILNEAEIQTTGSWAWSCFRHPLSCCPESAIPVF